MFTLRQTWFADLTHLIDSVSISYVFIMSIKSSCTPKPLHSGFKSQYQRRLVYLFACTWKCVFQMVPTCPGLFPPDPSRTAWKWQVLTNLKIFSIRIQTNMFCFTWHKMFFMLNKFEMWWNSKSKNQPCISWHCGRQVRNSWESGQTLSAEWAQQPEEDCWAAWLGIFFLFVFGTGTMFTAQLSTLFTPGKEESIWGDGWRSQAGHLLHNFCGSALRQPKFVHQPTNHPHPPPTSTSTSTTSRGYASAPLTLELLNPCSATHTSWPKS